ncbi:hypothetical protein X771_08435 [Mesorhizobium sp. LSJC277A00]|nr:hypothetical protein X771_08435 [Mesorhizobium sp. LSJC277A00]
MNVLNDLLNGNDLDAFLKLARLLTKADSHVGSSRTDEREFLEDVAAVIKAAVQKETKTLTNRVTLLEVAASAQKSAKPIAKMRTAKVKL